MAVQSANDLLGSILFQVQTANGYMEKIAKNSVQQNTAEATSGIKGKIVQTQGKFAEITGAVKTLSQIKIKDIAKIVAMPLGLVAKKIKSFAEDLGSINKNKAEKALTASRAFGSIITQISDINTAKLITTLTLYPYDELSTFTDSMKDLITKLSKIPTTTVEPKITALNKIITDLNSLKIKKLQTNLKLFGEEKTEKALTGFSEFIDKLVETFHGKFDKKERDSITEKINAVSDITTLMASSLAKMAVLGILTPILVPLSIVGLAGVAYYLFELNILTKAFKRIGSTENVLSSTKDIKNVGLLNMMAAGIVLSAAVIGLLLVKPDIWKAALAGFGAIALTSAILIGVLALINKIGEPKNVTKSLNGVANVLILMSGAALIPMLAIGLGKLIMLTGLEPIAIGFVAMGVTLLGFWGAAALIRKVGDAANGSIKPAMSIILLAFTSIAIVLAASAIGKSLTENGGWEYLLNGMGATAAVIGEFGALGLIIGGIGKLVNPKKMLASAALIMGIGFVSILLTKQVMELSEFFGNDISAGWKKFGSTLGAMAAIVGEFGVLAMAMGALLTNPITAWLVVSGTALMLGLSGAIAALAGAMKKTLEVSELLGKSPNDTDSTKAPITNMVNFLANSKELLKEVSSIGKGLSFFAIHKTIYALNGVVGALGEYAKILQTVGGKEGFIKGISGYDDKGNPIYGEEVDIKLTSENLASGFSTFVTVVLSKLNSIDWKAFKFTTVAKIALLMDPVSKFAKIMQEVGAEAGKIKGIDGYDDNGNPIYGKDIEVVPVATNISTSFGIFATKVMTGLQKVSVQMSDLLKTSVIKDIMEPVSQFAKIIQDFGSTENEDELTVLRFNEEGKVIGRETVNIKTISSRIANSFITFTKEMQRVTKTFEKKSIFSSQPDISDILEPLTDALTDMKDKLTTSDVEDFTKNITNISTSLDSLQKLYVSDDAKALNKTLPDLTKKHVDFIKKMNDAMNNIKTPMEKYVEQVERLANAYERLSAKYDENGKLVLTLEENTNTNNNINVDKNALETLADDISSKINSGTIDAINGMSMTMPNPVKNPNMPNLSIEISTTN